MKVRTRAQRDPCTVCFQRAAVHSCVARVGLEYCGERLCEVCARPAPSTRGAVVCPRHAPKSDDDGGSAA